MEILLSQCTLITFSVATIDCRKGKVAELPGILLLAEMFFSALNLMKNAGRATTTEVEIFRSAKAGARQKEAQDTCFYVFRVNWRMKRSISSRRSEVPPSGGRIS